MPSIPKTLPRLCVALGLPTADEMGRVAEQEYKDGSVFFEFRLDHLRDPAAGVTLIRDFVRTHADAYILATCRHRHAGGHFSGGLDRQLRILSESAAAGASLVDLEIESAEKLASGVERLRELALLILSYHDFEKTPALDSVFRRLLKIPADLYKVATTARKPTDNLRVLEFARKQEISPVIVLAMSEIGIPSRVLAPAFGSVFTFGAPGDKAGTAPGQTAACKMRALYRSEKLTKKSRVFGVVADPVSHSKSPLIHNRAFQARRLDAVYLPFLVPSGQLNDWMTTASRLPVQGFSVTIPHKRKIMRYLDVVEPLARRIGAVNTVWRKGGKWRGANTDAEGVLKPLGRHMRLQNASILIAGYGGAARAAAIALRDAGAKITITGRKDGEARSLASVVKGQTVSLEEARKGKFDALVHATPVGMVPNEKDNLFSEGVPAAVVLDMVYNPHETALLKLAKQQGCRTIAGIEMLLEQAAAQFEIWTGESAPRSVMRNALGPLA